jgi:DNA-binding MarR family transcriptional regulator
MTPRDPAVRLENRTAYRFALLSAMSTRSIVHLCQQHGVTVVGWRTLSLIGNHEPIYPSDIAERSSVDPDKVTRSVDRLVRHGLVARREYALDRRRVVLTLTPRGRAVYKQIEQVRRAMEIEFLSVLSREEQRIFAACLDKLEAQARRIFPGNRADRAGGRTARAGAKRPERGIGRPGRRNP